MSKHAVEIDDEIKWQGRTRKITKLVSVLLGEVEDVICFPVDATRVEVFNDENSREVAS